MSTDNTPTPGPSRIDTAATSLKAAIDLRVETAERYASAKADADLALQQAEQARNDWEAADTEFRAALSEANL